MTSLESYCFALPCTLTVPVVRGTCGNWERDGAVELAVTGVVGWVEAEPEVDWASEVSEALVV